ncbi:MAG TPA: hypothetical protein VE983_07705 [Solirubrobacteraceae bacterium]|nr:hypothetical protein [Solirubrobacteraceae bacterium]
MPAASSTPSTDEVSAILGHSGIQITADTYGHLYEQRRREIADGMDAFLRGGRQGAATP